MQQCVSVLRGQSIRDGYTCISLRSYDAAVAECQRNKAAEECDRLRELRDEKKDGSE